MNYRHIRPHIGQKVFDGFDGFFNRWQFRVGNGLCAAYGVKYRGLGGIEYVEFVFLVFFHGRTGEAGNIELVPNEIDHSPVNWSSMKCFDAALSRRGGIGLIWAGVRRTRLNMTDRR